MGSHQRLSGMQAKLHRWAAADPGRRLDDLFNLVCDSGTLLAAFERLAGNEGAKTPGVDDLTAVNIQRAIGPCGVSSARCRCANGRSPSQAARARSEASALTGKFRRVGGSFALGGGGGRGRQL